MGSTQRVVLRHDGPDRAAVGRAGCADGVRDAGGPRSRWPSAILAARSDCQGRFGAMDISTGIPCCRGNHICRTRPGRGHRWPGGSGRVPGSPAGLGHFAPTCPARQVRQSVQGVAWCNRNQCCGALRAGRRWRDRPQLRQRARARSPARCRARRPPRRRRGGCRSRRGSCGARCRGGCAGIILCRNRYQGFVRCR